VSAHPDPPPTDPALPQRAEEPSALPDRKGWWEELNRRAAINGLASIAVTSAVVNLLLKPLGRRHRPHRDTQHVPITRQVTMPRSPSFPSGHAASASAFATGVATAWPEAAIPLSAAALLVAYSRVHTGVHYPVDVIAGDIVGTTLAQLTSAALGRRLRPRPKG
jgi:membrane-associated phospholipid phosphatase